MVLKKHFVNSPWTKPSVATIFTGLYPTAHGSRIGQLENLLKNGGIGHGVEILEHKIMTMAELLKKNGYQTHAFINNYHLIPKFGYAQGFDQFHLDLNGSNDEMVCNADLKIIQEAKILLENRKKKPLFIWCHLMSVHGYQHPSSIADFVSDKQTPLPEDTMQLEIVKRNFQTIEEMIDSYDRSILFVDSLVDDLFYSIKQHAPDTLFIIMSDHGEEFYEHGNFEHCHTLYNELLKVPCVFWGAGVPKGEYPFLSDSLDIFPTLMDFLGVSYSGKGKRGHILFSGGQILENHEKEIFAEQHHRGPFRRYALIKAGQKLIVSIKKANQKSFFEFYEDGLNIEKNPISSRTDPKFQIRIDFLIKSNEAYFKNTVGAQTFVPLTEKDIERLRSLGYVH